MKIADLIEKLERIKERRGDVYVLFLPPEDSPPGEPRSITTVKYQVAKKDQYPEYYEMPKGFKFVLIEN